MNLISARKAASASCRGAISTGLNLTGVKWPLKDKALTLGTSFTMSNVALGPVKLSFTSGIAIAIAYPTQTD